ncbi:MAG: esterase [Labilithrix sp.]|nr:esterase [Labilithrix sp.]
MHYASSSAPAAALTLRGSAAPLSWDVGVPLASPAAGLYEWHWQVLDGGAPTDLEVKPLLGDTWSRGPNFHVKGGSTVDLYPRFTVTHGTVDKRWPAFVSTKLPSTRGVWVYLPPTYVENTEARFGVTYMHDGANLFDASLAFGGNEWKVDETLDAAAEDGSVRETIVVGVESTAARIDELTPTADPMYGGGKADQYLAMLIDEIKPKVDQELRTRPGREDTAIMGSSLGGLVSAYAGVTHADVFGLVGAMSPSTWWDGTVILADVDTTTARAFRPLRVYVDSGNAGTSNDDVTNSTELAARDRKVGYVDGKDLDHVVQPGAEHNEIYWAQRLPAALHFLLGARPD